MTKKHLTIELGHNRTLDADGNGFGYDNHDDCPVFFYQGKGWQIHGGVDETLRNFRLNGVAYRDKEMWADIFGRLLCEQYHQGLLDGRRYTDKVKRLNMCDKIKRVFCGGRDD